MKVETMRGDATFVCHWRPRLACKAIFMKHLPCNDLQAKINTLNTRTGNIYGLILAQICRSLSRVRV